MTVSFTEPCMRDVESSFLYGSHKEVVADASQPSPAHLCLYVKPSEISMRIMTVVWVNIISFWRIYVFKIWQGIWTWYVNKFSDIL